MEDYSPAARRPKDRWMWFFLIGLGAALVVTRPILRDSLTGGDRGTAGCLNNLQQIGVAYALYARDFNGKFPRGVDPEDRYNPKIWQQSDEYGSLYFGETQTTPFLHVILRPYVPSAETFHCPDDDGWDKSNLPGNITLGLTDIHPSSYDKFGTSYYCLTKYGFTNLTPADLNDPGTTMLLFDGDVWHGKPRDSLNGLFADGHTANLSGGQFANYLDSQ